MSDPKLKYEIVEGRRPIVSQADREALAEEGSRINETDARDGTNEWLDAMFLETLEDE